MQGFVQFQKQNVGYVIGKLFQSGNTATPCHPKERGRAADARSSLRLSNTGCMISASMEPYGRRAENDTDQPVIVIDKEPL